MHELTGRHGVVATSTTVFARDGRLAPNDAADLRTFQDDDPLASPTTPPSTATARSPEDGDAVVADADSARTRRVDHRRRVTRADRRDPQSSDRTVPAGARDRGRTAAQLPGGLASRAHETPSRSAS